MNRGKWILVTVIGAAAAVLFGPNGPLGGYWGVEGGEAPPAGLIAYAIVSALAFGFGIAWLLFGRESMGGRGGRATAAYLAIGWGLVSWAPHEALHQAVGDDLGALAAIEWGFHATMIAAVLVVASYLMQTIRSGTAAPV